MERNIERELDVSAEALRWSRGLISWYHDNSHHHYHGNRNTWNQNQGSGTGTKKNKGVVINGANEIELWKASRLD